MATKKFNKRARELGTGFATLGLSSAVVAGMGSAGGSATVTNAAQAGLATAGRFGGVFAAVSFGGLAIQETKKFGSKNRKKFKY